MSHFEMTEQVTTNPQVRVMEVTGRVDSTNATTFGEQLRALSESEINNFVLILNVEQMSSAPFRELVAFIRSCKNSGKDVKFAKVNERVAEVIAMATDLREAFRIYDSLPEAILSFSGAGTFDDDENHESSAMSSSAQL